MNLVILLIIIIILSLFIILLYVSKNVLKCKRYKIELEKLPKSLDNLKIVHITDVHSKIFGENNSKVIQMVKKENPDLVVMTGDIISQYETDIDRFISMYEEIYKNYPVYYSIGNHERKLGYNRYKYYIDKLRENNVHVIVNGKEEYKKGNETIIINALKFRRNVSDRNNYDENKEQEYINYMREKLEPIDENKFNILLTHDAEDFELYSKLNVDLVFAGHIHGGLIRIGKLCLLSPRRKLFPKYAYGVSRFGNSTMVASSGMGDASLKIRLFNRPEIVSVTLKCKVEN